MMPRSPKSRGRDKEMLKLGTETGSVINNIMSRQILNKPKAEVGMGATLLYWTDREAATIVEVIGDGLTKGTIIGVRTDAWKVISGSMQDGSAEFEYMPRDEGNVSYFRITKTGTWESIRRNPETGRWNKIGNGGIRIGSREKYHDPCF